MKSKKKNNTVKWGIPIRVVKSDLPNLDNDPFFVKKREEAIKSLTENPPPEWILKKMRGED
jgi:hypothetical protein